MVAMKLGISMSGFPAGTEAGRMRPLLSRLARCADEAGFDSLWTMDHFFQIPITGLPPEAPLLEAYAVLAFLAAETERIRIGTMVTCVAYRHPGFADDLKHKLNVLRSHCADVGRDYDAIEKTVSTLLDTDRDRTRILDHLAELADLGIDHAMMSPRRPWDEATLDWLAALVPDVHAISSRH
jgi:alkanesulfonate monooxygenase SsuD/methylene tetrahydromethanopterin reductase-like flavin-dependent oxidoreductase (luciferase family)